MSRVNFENPHNFKPLDSMYFGAKADALIRKLENHLFFDDCLKYLNFNSVNDEICTLNNVKAIKLIFKISLE